MEGYAGGFSSQIKLKFLRDLATSGVNTSNAKTHVFTVLIYTFRLHYYYYRYVHIHINTI